MLSSDIGRRACRTCLALVGLGIAALLCTGPALAASTSSAAAVLARAKLAAGGDALSRLHTLHLVERVSGQGISGQGEEWDDLATGRFVSSQLLGPAGGAQGFDGSHAWNQDATGLAHVVGSVGDTSSALTQAYFTSLAYWFPQRRSGTISFEREATANGRSYDVLRANPRGGNPTDVWFDRSTHLVARLISHPGTTQAFETDLSDYRSVDGAAIPFSVVLRDPQGNAFATSVARADANVDVANRFAMPTTQPRDFSMSGGAASTTFPIDVINNHIFLKAMVDGKGPFRFIFDTGGQGILNPDVAKALGIRPAGNVAVGGAGAGTVQTGVAWVPAVQLGNAVMTHQSFAVLPLGPTMQAIEGVHIDGMVGYETAARYRTTIDYARQTMTLTLPNRAGRPAGSVVPFVFDSTIPQIGASVDGLAGRFIVDTGSRKSLVLTTPFVQAHGLRARYAPSVTGIFGYGIGGPSRAQLTRVRQLKIGSVAIADVIAGLGLDTMGAMADPTIAGNIGAGVLKRFTVTLDYPNQRLYLAPNADFAKRDEGDRSGLVLVAAPIGIVAIGVLTDTPSSAAGIRAGNRILEANGMQAAQLGLLRLRALLSQRAGQVVRLTVLSGAQKKAVTLTLRDYV